MHSSISNFEREPSFAVAHACPRDSGAAAEKEPVRRATVLLLAGLLALLCAAELCARFLFPAVSRIQGRIEQDRRDVNELETANSSGLRTVLLAGNSLLLQGLDYPEFRGELKPDAVAVRYVIENTEYIDWYYGLQHLFAQGIKPLRVVLCMNLGQFLGNRGLGDYSAYYLFGVHDLLPAARDAGLDNTETSGLIFAHWSAFYASRSTIRNYLLNTADPGYARALHVLAQVPPVFPPEAEKLAQSRTRLRALNDLCQSNGSAFVLVLPPALTREGELLFKAGALEHVDVDVPVALGSLGPEFFQDRFHLNGKGAHVFTQALARDLHSRINPVPTGGSSAPLHK